MKKINVILGTLLFAAGPHSARAQAIGLFEGHQDVGTVLTAGTVAYDPATKTYTLTGSGENMWATADAFHFVWKKVAGDIRLSASIASISEGGDAHRKAVLMIRQSLDGDSAYADIAVHGDGLTSLQARDQKGAATHEVQSNRAKPSRIAIEKRGNYFYASVGGDTGDLERSGGSMRVPMDAPFYIGIGVCAHNKDAVVKVSFTNVAIELAPDVKPKDLTEYSTLETVTVQSTDRRTVLVSTERIEAPNWTKDGNTLVFNRGGRLERILAAGGTPESVNTAPATRIASAHGLSPDGAWIAFTDDSKKKGSHSVYIAPAAGGEPRLVAENAAWRAWSPDGKTLLVAAERMRRSDIFSVPAAGGSTTRLTTSAAGSSDYPEFSPDGKYIYFASDRTGASQIWRMLADGTEHEQIITDEMQNWYPHLSPDGRRIVMLSREGAAKGPPHNEDVMLRILNLADKRVTVLAKLIGGQGTIDAPSWSPDGRRLSFVSYQLLPKK